MMPNKIDYCTMYMGAGCNRVAVRPISFDRFIQYFSEFKPPSANLFSIEITTPDRIICDVC